VLFLQAFADALASPTAAGKSVAARADRRFFWNRVMAEPLMGERDSCVCEGGGCIGRLGHMGGGGGGLNKNQWRIAQSGTSSGTELQH
jgi:hypothetical protein